MANFSNITNRRAVVAGLALSPAAGLPAAAQMMLTVKDPVFDAVEVEREAERAWYVAADAFNKAEERWSSIESQYPDHIVFDGEKLSSHAEIASHFKNPQVRHLLRLALRDELRKINPDCEKNVSFAPPTDEQMAAYNQLVLEARQQFDAAVVRRLAAKAETGFPVAEAEMNAQMEVWDAAQLAFLQTVPTTAAGAVTLTKFVHKYLHDGGHEEDVLPALDNLAEFLSAGIA
ncbi:MAG: hypothetical protein K2Y29_11420 [Beijerinckiaceae bacterium]|nr:hypothetical protein [Beijerinckiaceae bacterium]